MQLGMWLVAQAAALDEKLFEGQGRCCENARDSVPASPNFVVAVSPDSHAAHPRESQNCSHMHLDNALRAEPLPIESSQACSFSLPWRVEEFAF
jgi:hypothetical protein